MSRRLDDLSPRMLPLAMQLIARCVEAGIMVMIIDTRRTLDEQKTNMARGVSWTLNSKHLTGDAIDICPYSVYDLSGPDKLNWDPGDPIWQKIGAIGEGLGLTWGGRWKQADMGHFEVKT
jgi:peptidoglycan L-alanyl-D-glutamate endopeptidase CwlK